MQYGMSPRCKYPDSRPSLSNAVVLHLEQDNVDMMMDSTCVAAAACQQQLILQPSTLSERTHPMPGDLVSHMSSAVTHLEFTDTTLHLPDK